MIRPQSAVFFLEEDSSLMEGSKPRCWKPFDFARS